MNMNKKASRLVTELGKCVDGPVVEIGAMRSTGIIDTDGASTLYLARKCERDGRPFTSFDPDPRIVEIANNVLSDDGLDEIVVQMNGVEGLKSIGPVAFLYLDETADPGTAYEQFITAEIIPGGVILVDDVQRLNNSEFGRGDEIIPRLYDVGYEDQMSIMETEPGYDVLIVYFPDGKAADSLISPNPDEELSSDEEEDD